MRRFLALVFIAILFCVCSYIEHNYTKENCTVSKVTEQFIEIQDNTGNVWRYRPQGLEQFAEGQKVKLKLNDNCTDSYLQDDIITRVIKE